MNDQAKNILNELLADIPDDINKREGSVVYTILAPVAMKLAQKEKEDAAAQVGVKEGRGYRIILYCPFFAYIVKAQQKR